MRRTLLASLTVGVALCIGCGSSTSVIDPGEGYEMTKQEQANQAKFNATRDREHAKEELENDPKARKKKAAQSASRNYGR